MARNNKKESQDVTIKINVKPGSIAKVSKSQIMGFVDFIRTQGVIGLAVGLILGGAVGTTVKSLVDNVIMPPIGLLLGSTEGLKGLSVKIGESASGAPVILGYGVFLNDLINFIIIAFVVYFLVKLLKVENLDKKKN